jgi:hypothetical protein
VSVKETRKSNGFPTLLTHIRFLSIVSSFISLRVTYKTEEFPTLFTSIGLLPSVRSVMSEKETNHWRLSHIVSIHRVSIQCESFHAQRALGITEGVLTFLAFL